MRNLVKDDIKFRSISRDNIIHLLFIDGVTAGALPRNVMASRSASADGPVYPLFDTCTISERVNATATSARSHAQGFFFHRLLSGIFI